MPNKVVIFFKRIGRNWFFIFIVIVFFIFLFGDRLLAIWLIVFAIIFYVLSYIPPVFKKNFLHYVLRQYYMVEDDTVAHIMRKSLRETREALFKLSQAQKNKKYLIVFHENRYIYFHAETIAKFIDLYQKGHGEKEMLDGMKNYDIEKKTEIKCIMMNLKVLGRLPGREVSVKEYRDKEKYQ